MIVVEGLDSADDFLQLMRPRIDEIIVGDLKIQHFLEWLELKSESVETKKSITSVRAFYFALTACTITLEYNADFANAFGQSLSLALAPRPSNFELDRDIDLSLSYDFMRSCDVTLDFEVDLSLALNLSRKKLPMLHSQLQRLQDQMPDFEDSERFTQWLEEHLNQWTEDLRQIMIEYRNIGHDWQFTDDQKKKLQQYYNANLLLAECLNSECYLSREVREEIEGKMIRKN